MVQLKSREEIQAIGRSGKIISALFREIKPRMIPGATTRDLDRFADDFIRSHEDAVPAFKGLYGFPGSACISINEEIVHGLPSKRRLAEGDIVSVDVGVRRNGWCADAAYTFSVGEISPAAQDLLNVTRQALHASVKQACVQNHVGDFGAAVVRVVRGTGYGICRDLVGHGIGRDIHEEPQVPNVGKPGSGAPLAPGMVLAVEPMLSAGSSRIKTLADKWTIVTADGALSAHFEHTVAVTREGPKVLTGGGIWDLALQPAAESAAESAEAAAEEEGTPGHVR